MELEAVLLERAEGWEGISRWERSELGKDLRRAGLSYSEIMDLIPVKKSTLATWCRDIELSEEQLRAMARRRTPSPGQDLAGNPYTTQTPRRREILMIRSQARESSANLVGDPLWIAGVLLYWAEGAKTRNHLALANADPRALRLFVLWVRTYIDSSAQFSIQLHLHEGNDDAVAQRYWREQTGLNESNFYKTFIKPKGTGHRKNHLVHGVCTIKMRRAADAWNIVIEWIDVVAEHFGVDRPPN